MQVGGSITYLEGGVIVKVTKVSAQEVNVIYQNTCESPAITHYSYDTTEQDTVIVRGTSTCQDGSDFDAELTAFMESYGFSSVNIAPTTTLNWYDVTAFHEF